MHSALLVLVMSLMTILLRGLPFWVFRDGKEIPEWLNRLANRLPAAINGMLVVYCLRAVQLTAAPFGIPELVSVAFVVLLQATRRNSLLSILGGTAVYMALLHVM